MNITTPSFTAAHTSKKTNQQALNSCVNAFSCTEYYVAVLSNSMWVTSFVSDTKWWEISRWRRSQSSTSPVTYSIQVKKSMTININHKQKTGKSEDESVSLFLHSLHPLIPTKGTSPIPHFHSLQDSSSHTSPYESEEDVKGVSLVRRSRTY